MIIINKLITLFPILFYPFINIIILFLLGFGLTFLILPKSLRFFWLWLSPWTTIIVSILLLVIVSLFGLSVKQVIWPLIAIFLGIDLFVLFRIKPRFSINIKEDFLLASFVLISLIFNLSPLIRRDRIVTTISLGNNDVISYTTTGDYLKNNSISKSFKEKVEPSTGVLLNDGYRWGTPIINSFFLTMFGFDGYQYTYTSEVILFSLFIPLCYVLFQILFGQSTIGLIMVSVFTGFNVNLLYILYHNFFGQVLFWGIEILLFVFFYLYLFSKEVNIKKYNLYDYNIGVLISVLFFSYLEPAIFMFAPLILFLLVSRIFLRKKISNYIFALIRITSISLIISSVSIVRAIVLMLQQASLASSDKQIGWQLFRQKIPYANPFEAMGFYSIHSFEPISMTLAIILSVFVIYFVFYGLLSNKFKQLSISYLIIFILFYYWTGIHLHNFFAYNRALTYTLPLIIIFFVMGLVKTINKNKLIGLFILIVLIFLEGYSALKLNKRFITEHLSVDKSYISILDLKNIKISESIYTENFIDVNVPLWKQIWINYFLYSKKISVIPTVFNDQEYQNKIPDNSLVLLSNSTPWIKSPKILFRKIIWNNMYYQLGRICNSDDCLKLSNQKLSLIQMGKSNYEDSLLISGWYSAEGESRWANEKESTLRLVTKVVPPTKLIIEALSLSKPQEMTIYLDDELLGTISIGTEWKNYSLPMSYFLNLGVHKLKFIYSNGIRPMDVIPGNLDGRTLYINFKKIALE